MKPVAWIALAAIAAVGLVTCMEVHQRAAHSEPPPPSPSQLDALRVFNVVPQVRAATWVRGDLVLAVSTNTSDWEAAANTGCRLVRDQGVTEPFRLSIVEANVAFKGRYRQLASVRCR